MEVIINKEKVMGETEIAWAYYPRVAVHPAARAFVERLQLQGKRPKTVDAYARSIEDLLAYFSMLGPKRLVEADEADLEGSVRTENKSQCGDSSCGILTITQHIFRRSDP